MKSNKHVPVIHAISAGVFCLVVLFLVRVDHSYHFVITQLLLVQVLVGVLYYRRWVPIVTVLLLAVHVAMDAERLSGVPVAALGESAIQLGVLWLFLHVTRKREVLNERLRQVIEATRVGTWQWNLKTNQVLINDQWAAMLGYTKEELEPVTIHTWETLAHPDDLIASNAIIEAVIQGEREYYDIDARMRHKDGHYVWIQDRGNITRRDHLGQPIELSGTHTDITARQLYKQEIEYYHNLMSHIIDHMNSGIAVHDKDLNYIYVSKRYLDQYKLTEDIIGRHHYEVFPDLPQKWRDVHQRVLQGEVVKADRDPFPRADGTIDITRWECRPWYDNQGNIGGIIVYTEVITDFIEIEQELTRSNELLETVITNVPIGLAVMAPPPTPDFLYINDRFYDIFGIDDAIKQEHNIWERLYADPTLRETERKRFFDDLAAAGGASVTWTDEPRIKNGEIVQYLTITATPMPASNLLVVMVDDTTARKQLELSLEEKAYDYFVQKTESEATLMAIGDAVISTDGEGIITAFNDIAVELTGYQKDEAVGHPFCEIFVIIGEDTGEPLPCPVREVIETKRTTHLQNHTILITKEGEHRIIEDSAAPIHNQDGEMIGVILVFRDVTEQKKKQEEIRYLSLHDHLTGLYNRRYFSEQLARLDQVEHYPLGVMMIDLNGLKIINDAYGHEVGDEALKRSAQVMKDVIGDRGVLARVGGDEFTVVVSNTTQEELQSLKEAILDDLSGETVQNMTLSLSIGYEIKTDDTQSLADLLKDAENIMYKYKLASGDSVRNHAIQAIYKTLTDKYELERNHSHRVSELSVALGKALGMHADELNELELSGLFHDIGKISLPDSILNKPSRLTKEEYDIVKSHTRNGYAILRAADEYSDLAKNALYHHEHYDGGGYPDGLKGDAIPIQSRIIHIADAFEAMTSDRPYRKALPEATAIAELKKYRGTQFDPDLLDVFLEHVVTNT
jgi:diguanylate cyclase (GGDEF)-like protein/PAS domain S-box-containing protein